MFIWHEDIQNFRRLAIIVLCINLASTNAKRSSTKVDYDGKALNVPINPEKITDLYQHWTDQMFSGLFAAIASKKLKQAPEHVKDGLEQCSKNSKSVILHAKCVSALLHNKFDTEEFRIRLENKKNQQQTTGKTEKKKRPQETKQYQAFAQEIDPVTTTFAPLKILSKIAKHHQHLLKTPNHSQQYRSREIRRHPTSRQHMRNINIQSLPLDAKSRVQHGNPLHYSPQSTPGTSNRFQKLSYHKVLTNKKTKSQSYYQWPGLAYTSRVDKVLRKRRMKREVIQRNGYELKAQYGDMTALGAVAKLLSKTLLVAKNKTATTSWQLAVERIRDRAKKQKEMRKKQKEAENEHLEQFAFRGMRREGIDVEDLMEENPKELKKILHDKRIKDAAKDPKHRLIGLLRDGVKLGYSIVGRNTSDFDDKTLKAFSPRIMSVVPEQEDDDLLDFLSPSLFSLHNKGKGMESLTSLPNLVKGFSSGDQQEWMNFIIEAAGVNEQVERLEKDPNLKPENIHWDQPRTVASNQTKKDFHKQLVRKDYAERMRDKDGKPLYFTKENVTEMFGTFEERKISTWEMLISTYTKEQLKEMNSTGYTTLTKKQLYILYGPQSPFNNSEALHRLTRMNTSEIHKGIEMDVHRVSMMRSFQVRQKDITLSPIVLTPLVLAYPIMNQFIVLSPVVLSPVVLTPAVLGPVVLSPWVFVPVILSPRVLSPLILNPLVFTPIVLSPLVLHPLILSPGVFAPIVLSPLVLSPFILSPQVFTPVILSPLVLNPLILNPMVGSPLVLSPFVLSPVILSPQALFGVILSPYALSPLVESKLILSTIFLSPSWLS